MQTADMDGEELDHTSGWWGCEVVARPGNQFSSFSNPAAGHSSGRHENVSWNKNQ